MSSKAFLRDTFLYPDEEPSGTGDKVASRNKQVNIYEAVAGRINSHGFIPKQRVFASTRDTASSSTTAVPPENTLYKRQNAPLRYAESDVYFANERMPNLKLPDSDLLKALHCYTSDFYEQAVDDGTSDFKSFDETALLALGILMEEGVKEIIGRTGDQVFTEGEVVVSPLRKNPGNAPDEDGRQSKKRKIKE